MVMRTQRIDLVLGDEMPAFVVLHTHPDGSSVLSWNDGATNEWVEDYPTLSLALMRLAILARHGEAGGGGFTGDVNAFLHRANWFLDQEVG